MREHKYKAWHKDEKIMCDVSLINFDKGAFLIGVKKGDDQIYGRDIVIAPSDGRFCEFDEIELLEYTGLKDRNGVEIYESDLVINSSRNGGNPHIIKWSEAFGGWIGNYNGLAYLIAQELHEIKVIGNIHSNPELIN